MENSMRDATVSGVRFSCFVVLTAVAACSVPDHPVVSGSTDDRETDLAISRDRDSTLDAADGSLAALTAEVRRLRVAVEELARSQRETQALAVQVSAQQSRIAQGAERLDALRREVDSATTRSQELEARLAGLSDALPRATEREKRAELEDAIQATKAEQSRIDLELRQTRSREDELSRALQLEEARWNELISHIEHLTQ